MHPASTRRLLDVEDLATRGAVLTGSIEPGSMPRLLEVVAEPPAPDRIPHRVHARRGGGARGWPGAWKARLPLVCQRCLDGLGWRFEVRFESLVIGDEHTEGTDEWDAVVCPEGRIALAPVIEDELLLALPGAPVHAHGSCEAPPFRAGNEALPAQPANPFSALRTLHSHPDRDPSS